MPLLAGVAERSLCWTGLIPLLAFEPSNVRAINIAAIVTIVDITSPFQIVDVRLMNHQRGEDYRGVRCLSIATQDISSRNPQSSEFDINSLATLLYFAALAYWPPQYLFLCN